ncbi:MAG: adenylate kinase [Syntrophales bacterium]
MNILIFGPNGSGKGTQGAVIREKFAIPHIEAGVIFRNNINGATELGNKARIYIERGDLVPDEITVPMVLKRLQEADCLNGWLLDGFPRNITQATALQKSLAAWSMILDYIIEITLDRVQSKERIMGRRLCPQDNNHPNNIFIDTIKPITKDGKIFCRVCGADNLTTRADDQDEAAIDQRHDVYYDMQTGTMAAVNYFRNRGGKLITVDGRPSVAEVTGTILEQLA